MQESLERTLIEPNSRITFNLDGFCISFGRSAGARIIPPEHPTKDMRRQCTPGTIILPSPESGHGAYIHLLGEEPKQTQFIYELPIITGTESKRIVKTELKENLIPSGNWRSKIIPLTSSKFIYGGLNPGGELFTKQLEPNQVTIYQTGDMERFIQEYWNGK